MWIAFVRQGGPVYQGLIGPIKIAVIIPGAFKADLRNKDLRHRAALDWSPLRICPDFRAHTT